RHHRLTFAGACNTAWVWSVRLCASPCSGPGFGRAPSLVSRARHSRPTLVLTTKSGRRQLPSATKKRGSDQRFRDKKSRTLLAKSSENPKRALAREYKSTAVLSNQIIADLIGPSPGRER